MINDATLGSPIQQAPISFTGVGDNIIVPGSLGFKISVLQFFFILSGSTTLIYKSGVTALTGPLQFLAVGSQVQDFIQLPLTCNDGDPFIISTNVSITLGGTIWYFKAPSLQ